MLDDVEHSDSEYSLKYASSISSSSSETAKGEDVLRGSTGIRSNGYPKSYWFSTASKSSNVESLALPLSWASMSDE